MPRNGELMPAGPGLALGGSSRLTSVQAQVNYCAQRIRWRDFLGNQHHAGMGARGTDSRIPRSEGARIDSPPILRSTSAPSVSRFGYRAGRGTAWTFFS